MQSEEYDKKIREAAERHHPAYDETAWAGMEKLLDKHMPQEKERKRRLLLLIFLFLLVGGGFYVYYNTGIKEPNHGALSLNEKKTGEGPVKDKDPGSGKQGTFTIRDQQQNLEHGIQENTVSITGLPTGPVVKNKAKEPGLLLRHNKTADGLTKHLLEKNEPEEKKETEGFKSPRIAVEEIKEGTRREENVLPVKTPESIKTNLGITNTVGANKEDKIADKQEEKQEEKKIRLGKRNRGIVFLFASLAPDLSIVGTSSAGKIKLGNGIGAGFSRGRLSIRAGFFTARKVYDAYPKDYKAPAQFYTYYPNLEEIKADCRVYELPLLVSYSFGKKKNWMATTGLSSYLMKRETYDYYYRYTPTSPVVSRQRTIRNENNHYFSVLTLSAGYQLPVNKRISLVAEPYVKVPVGGIGFGKVKLNSAGIMVSATFKPFLSKNKN